MKASEIHRKEQKSTAGWGARTFSYALAFVMILILQVNACVRILMTPLKADPAGYCHQIEGVITTWWSALFMHECRFVLNVMRGSLGEWVPVEMSLFVVTSVSLWMMYASIVIFLRLLENRGAHIFIPSCILCSVAVSSYVIGSMTSVYLDAPGTALLFSSIVLTLCFYRGMTLRRKVLMSFAVFVLMLHAGSFRSPFLLLTPIISFYMVYMILPKVNFVKLAGCAVIVSCLFLLGVKSISCFLANSVKAYPMIAMMESDLHLASIFKGDGEYIFRLARKYNIPVNEDGATVAKRDSLVASYTIFDVKTEREWNMLCDEYVEQWRTNSIYMVEARLHQIFSFLTGEYYPDWYKGLVHSRHPHIEIRKATLGRYNWPKDKDWIRVGHLVALFVWGLGSCLPIVICFVNRKTRDGDACVIYMGALCFSSILCYLTLVVPTADFRYRMHMLMIGALSLSVCWSSIRSKWCRQA